MSGHSSDRNMLYALLSGAIVVSVPRDTLRLMSTDSTKKCMHCQGPIGSTVRTTSEGWGDGAPSQEATFYYCRNQCEMFRLTCQCSR